jgi:hypothetical protein
MSVVDVTTGLDYATLSAAITASDPNDVIQVSAGTYVENFPNITHNLTIEAVGGLAYLSTPSATPVNGRAVLNVPGDGNVSLTISGLAISGAVDTSDNGAGILFETGNANLTVENSWIYGNQDGILTGGTDSADPGGMNITITDSEFNDNGVAPSNPRYGYDHNIYIGAATSLDVTGSYFHDALGGHEIKTRALSSTIEDNRIQDGPTATTSYSIDFADGGTDVVSGNTIEKGQDAVNEFLVHFGGEGTYADSSLTMTGNTLIDDRGGSIALLNQTQDGGGNTIPAIIEDNTLYGFGTGNLDEDAYPPPYDTASGNTFLPLPGPVLDTAPPFEITCFVAGTRIAAALGAVAVERLRAGDFVRTVGGDLHPVRWVGRQTVFTRFADPNRVLPIRIRAGALAEGVPTRDLLVSPGHALLLGGLLVQAGALVNGRSILRARAVPEMLTYWHVELDAHMLLLAEGAAAESLLDGEDLRFDNADRPARRTPAAQLPFPRVKARRQMPDFLRRRLASRAVIVDGRDAAGKAAA